MFLHKKLSIGISEWLYIVKWQVAVNSKADSFIGADLFLPFHILLSELLVILELSFLLKGKLLSEVVAGRHFLSLQKRLLSFLILLLLDYKLFETLILLRSLLLEASPWLFTDAYFKLWWGKILLRLWCFFNDSLPEACSGRPKPNWWALFSCKCPSFSRLLKHPALQGHGSNFSSCQSLWGRIPF